MTKDTGLTVAGTIGGVGNNGLGVTGVSWEVSLMGLKFLDANGSGSTSDAVQAINYATMMRNQYAQNVRDYEVIAGEVVGRAMQCGKRSRLALRPIFSLSQQLGMMASNNDSNPQFPASYTSDAVISVAATNRNDSLAGFSNYGETSVDLAAPGVGIVSTVPGWWLFVI